MKKTIADTVASDMYRIMQSDEHQRVFAGPKISFVKEAAKKEDEKKDEKKPGKEKPGKDEKKSGKEKPGKDEKKPGKKMPEFLKKTKEKKEKCAASILGLAKISEILDNLGLVRSATAAINTLEVLVKEAEDMSYAKDSGKDQDPDPDVLKHKHKIDTHEHTKDDPESCHRHKDLGFADSNDAEEGFFGDLFEAEEGEEALFDDIDEEEDEEEDEAVSGMRTSGGEVDADWDEVQRLLGMEGLESEDGEEELEEFEEEESDEDEEEPEGEFEFDEEEFDEDLPELGEGLAEQRVKGASLKKKKITNKRRIRTAGRDDDIREIYLEEIGNAKNEAERKAATRKYVAACLEEYWDRLEARRARAVLDDELDEDYAPEFWGEDDSRVSDGSGEKRTDAGVFGHEEYDRTEAKTDQLFAMVQEWIALRGKWKQAKKKLQNDPNNREFLFAALKCEDDMLRCEMQLVDSGFGVPEVLHEEEHPYPVEAFRRSGP